MFLFTSLGEVAPQLTFGVSQGLKRAWYIDGWGCVGGFGVFINFAMFGIGLLS